MSNQVLVEIKNQVLTIRLNRPEKKNALTQAMYLAMTDGLRKAESGTSVRVVLLTGAADCFTAGNDLMDFASAKPGEPSVAVQFLQVLAGMHKPVVAAVGGVAVGIGTTMLLHCDLVYAAASARLLKETKARPGGHMNAFCEPAQTTSRPRCERSSRS